MDWSNPLSSLISYFKGTPTDSDQQQLQAAQQLAQAQRAQLQQQMLMARQQQAAMQGGGRFFKPTAEKPDPDEITINAYPTIHSLQPTKLNEGKPWAAQKVPTGYLDGLAYAKAKAEAVGGLDPETINQFLPLALRESRYHLGTAYGNNGVYVDYKTPPPKDLQSTVDQSNIYAKLERQAFDSGNMKVYEDFKSKREELDAKLLADPRWQSRADSYHRVTKYVKDLGLPQTTRQEITRDDKGNFVGKSDVYMAEDNAPYAIKALHVPLALYNKRYGEDRSGKGLELTKTFVGGGKEAVARNKQEAHIGNALEHEKNKPMLDYYNARYQHHKQNSI